MGLIKNLLNDPKCKEFEITLKDGTRIKFSRKKVDKQQMKLEDFTK